MSKSREIARLDLDSSALSRVLQSAAAGEDVAATLAAYGEDFGEDFGEELGEDFGEEQLGADIATLLNAVQGDEVVGSDFGEDMGDDFGSDDIAKGLNQLIQAATSGDYAAELGMDEIGARRRINRAANRVRGRRRSGRTRTPGRAAPRSTPSRAPAGRGFAARPAAPAAQESRQVFTRDMNRALDRTSPGEGPACPIPLNLAGGVTATVGAGLTQDITVRPPKDIVLTHLCVPGEYASRFLIRSITVENDSIFASVGEIPAEMFRPDSNINRLPNKFVRGGRDIVISVRNISGADSPFVGALVGDEGDLAERARRAG